MGDARRTSRNTRKGRKRTKGCATTTGFHVRHSCARKYLNLLLIKPLHHRPPRPMAPTFISSGAVQSPITPVQGASHLLTAGGTDLLSASQLQSTNGLPSRPAAVAGLPFSAQTPALPARPNLPDDPVIPAAGFATTEEAEKAFTHLLRKAGVDSTWTWDRTMRAIITDPLYKALGSLAEKKACWLKVSLLMLSESHNHSANVAS